MFFYNVLQMRLVDWYLAYDQALLIRMGVTCARSIRLICLILIG